MTKATADAPSATPSTDRCPRCGGGFYCGVTDAAPCPCGGLSLSTAQLQALRGQYSHCLCLTCLAAVAAGGAA